MESFGSTYAFSFEGTNGDRVIDIGEDGIWHLDFVGIYLTLYCLLITDFPAEPLLRLSLFYALFYILNKFNNRLQTDRIVFV